jgi:hypothetical protein
MKEKITQILMSRVADEVYGPGIYAIYIPELADAISKLYQPSEKPTLSEDKFFDCFGHSHTPRFVDEKPSAEEIEKIDK